MNAGAALAPDSVHLWSVHLADASWDTHAGVLSPAEAERAARYTDATVRANFTRCRAARRHILARYLDIPPRAIVFNVAAAGKPAVFPEDLQFNISHCGERAVIAISNMAVGVDLESYHRRLLDLAGLAAAILHPTEMLVFSDLSETGRRDYLLQLWTRKEAYCKLIGTGLRNPLSEITFNRHDAATQYVIDGNESQPDKCFIHDIDWIDTYAASLCIASPTVRWASFRARP
jgi:4'-phosphopantetheinyl transferase